MGSHPSKHAKATVKDAPKDQPTKAGHARHVGHELIYGGRPSLSANKGKGAWVRPRQKKEGGGKKRGDAEVKAGEEGGGAGGDGGEG